VSAADQGAVVKVESPVDRIVLGSTAKIPFSYRPCFVARSPHSIANGFYVPVQAEGVPQMVFGIRFKTEALLVLAAYDTRP